uniref:Vitellogenin n=1 Tax=Metapenaeus ensis TaxID=32278 RepID=Q7Z1G4_METEN|nr:vitellogenin [Metapenaeus ensis]
MNSSSLVLVLALVAGGLAAPREDEAPRCSTECPVTGSPKLAYEPGKTYTYAYSGKSKVQLKGVQDGDSDIEWAAGIDLTWITPCDVAISFTNIKMDGAPGKPDAARTLQRFPMVVAVAEGRVQHVCAHPEDQPWAINLKKGVASALQNSIPSLSPVASGITVTETDVIGKCPPNTKVKTEGRELIVTKEKEHRHCTEHFPTPNEVPAPWMKAPLPLEESGPECKQVIENGIYTAITCEDKHIVRPAFGLYKYVEANQESTLRFISESSDTSAISGITRGELEIESLLFNRETTKDPELAPEIDELMKEICDKTENTVEADAAALVDKALHMLRSVPAEVVEEVAEKVRGGRYCGHSERLESIFFDAVAFVHESGAVKVMVEEIENGRATGGRLALYTAALYFTPRPNIKAVEALTPLFESARPKPTLMLAAASMVNKYCHLVPNCHQEAPVERIARELANKVERHCTPSAGEEAEEEIVAALKALGNMGVVTPAVTSAAVTCIEEHEVPTSIRVAAAEVFRQAKCYRPAVEKLVDIATHPDFETEVRIVSYLAAIKCAEMEDLEKIINKITEEKNTQVRSFVLGHLINIQESTCPSKEHLRYLLTDFVIPTDFERDFRRVSRNVMMGYHSAAFEMGADVESNIIYAPGAFVPRALTMNLKADIDETHLDIGEIGARFEGVDSIIEEHFGPEGYLRKASFGKILEDITGFAEEKGYKVMEHLENTLRTRRSIDASTIADFFNKLYGERASDVRAEVFARIMGQEVTYANIAETLKGVTADKIIETFFSLVDDSLEELKGLNLNTSKELLKLHLYYSLPTIQGLHSRSPWKGTAVSGLKMEGNFHIAHILANPGNLDTAIKLYPGLSIHTTGFVGFDAFIAKAGIEMKNTISSATGAAIKLRTTDNKKIEMELELPEKMELINIKAETYLVKAVGKNVRKIAPSSMRDERFAHEACIDALEPALGLKVCYNVNIPDIFRANALPLGQPAIAKVYIEKADPSMKGYLVSATIKNKSGNKMIKVGVEAVGASTPREADMTIAYTMEEDSHIISAKIDATSITAGFWATLTNTEEYKAIETFMKIKAGAMDISRGIKVDLSAKEAGAEEVYAMNVFSGRNKKFTAEAHIFEAQIKKENAPEMKVDIFCKTKNALAEYIGLNIEVGADLMMSHPEVLYVTKYIPRVPITLPVKIRKMEVTTDIGGWKLESFIREQRESPETCEHISALKLTKGRRDIISVEATHTIEGRLSENIILKNEATVVLGRSSYKAKYDVFYHSEKVGAAVEVVRAGDNEKIVDVEAIYKRSGETHIGKFAVEIPEYIRPVKAEVRIAEEEDRYILEAAIRHGQRTLLEATGPVVARFSSKIAKVQANIKLVAFNTEPYIFATNLVFGNKKQVIALEIKERQEPVFGAEWKMVRENSEKTSFGVVLLLPALMENKIDAVITEELIHVSFNNLLLPKRPSERRVKGFVDVNLTEKNTNVEFAWDADRNPQKKLAVDAALISSPETPGHAEIHGNIVFAGEQYHMKLVLTATNLMRTLKGENGFKLFLTTPAQKTIAVEATTRVELEEAIAKIMTALKYKNSEDEEYKLTGIMALEKLRGPLGYAVKLKIICRQPETQEIMIHALVKHMWTPSEHLVQFKVEAEAPVLRKPVMVAFTLRNAEGSFTGICKMEREAPATVFGWDLKVTPEGGIEAVEASLDTKAIVEILKIVRAVVTFEETALRSYGAASKHYQMQFTRPNSFHHNTVLVKDAIFAPMEGEAKFVPQESLASSPHPNKGKFDTKYEIGYKMVHENRWGERETKWEAKMNHPVLSRPIMVAVKYTASEETAKGTIELDIFPEEENKITGTVETTRIAEDAIRAEVFLRGRLLKVNPKAAITVAYAPNTLGFDVVLHKTPSEAPVFKVSAKYDEIAARTAAIAFTVKMEGRPVFEVSGATEPEEEAFCNGIRMNAIMYAAALGKYDVISKMCKPAFAEVTVRRHSSEEEYIAKIGLRYPDTAEVGLYEASVETGERRPVAVAAVELASPTMMKVNEVTEALETIIMAIKPVAMNTFRYLEEEAAEKGVQFPSAHFIALMSEAKAEAEAIYREILEEVRMLDTEVIEEILASPAVSFIWRTYFDVWSQMARVHHKITAAIIRAVERYEEKLEGVTEMIMEIVMATSRMVETGELPEAVLDVVEEIKETEVFRIVKREVNAVLREYPEEYDAIKHVVFKVAEAFARDIVILRERIMEIPAVERTINWAIRQFTSERLIVEQADKIADFLLRELLFVSVEAESNGFELQIPLHRPLYSLTQVAQEAVPFPTLMLENLLWAYTEYIPIPVEDLIWAYYNFVPRHITEMTDMLPPFPRVAMVVGGTEILTFDGLVVRAPRSPCKVLLAAHGRTHRLIMSHPQASARPQFELKTPEATVVIKPDFEVVVNGRPLSSSEETVGKLRIENIGEYIEVASPVMKVIVAKSGEVVAVEASGWLFGRVAGLLGPNNGEVADNLLMPNGEATPNPRELVAAWQEDQAVLHPEVSLVQRTSVVRVVECETFLGIRSRCNPVVPPTPIHGDVSPPPTDAWDAAKAYRTICALKGVEEVFPIAC